MRLTLAALPIGLTFALLQTPLVPRYVTLIVLAVFAISLAAPASGLLVVAALAPLGHLLALGAGVHGLRVIDAIVVAFLAGWLLRGLPDRPGPAVAAPLAGWLLSALVVASMAGVAWHMGAGSAGAAAAFIDDVRGFFLLNDDRLGVIAGTRLLTGFALTAATVTLFRQRPSLAVRLPGAIVASASVAAVWMVVPWSVGGGFNISAPTGLARAFGAYFALVACLAIGMTVCARGRRRAAWAVASVCLLLGLVSAVFRAPYVVSGFRGTQPLIAATLRVLAARPLFGIGIGQDATTSPLFFSPWLSWNGGAADAHNLLVLGVELGLVGLALWLSWIGAGFFRVARALAIDRRDARLWGAASGVAAFTAALAVSRPLAFSQTAFPFMLQFGLMTALGGSTVLNAPSGDSQQAGRIREWTRRPWRRFAVAALGMSAVATGALVSARRGPIERPDLQDVDGFYGWELSSSGERFRWTDQYASVFVPAGVTSVRIPMRVPAVPGRPAIVVDVKTDAGIEQHATVDEAWTVLEIALPGVPPPARLRRIDLKASQAWQPSRYLPGSSDTRLVGVQVGEYQLVRDPS